MPVDTKLTLVARNANFPNITEVMEAIQQQLQEVGFNVDLQFRRRQFQKRNFQALSDVARPDDGDRHA